MKKRVAVVIMISVFLGLTQTAYADSWKSSDTAGGERWRYEEDDGTFARNGWYWLDGNRDGISECYYFDENGWMLSNTMTPDGYQVDGNGAWTQQGQAQVRSQEDIKLEVKDWTYDEFRNYSEYVEGSERIQTTGDEIGLHYIPDVVYAEPQGIPLKLQILLPYTRNTPKMTVPLVVYVQGSAWMQQNIYDNIPQISRLASRGYAVAVVQYRHSGQASFPAQIQDTRTAIRFMKQHAEEYNIDTNRIIVAGDSSGGHTAVMAGIATAGSEFDGYAYLETDADVSGIIDLYGAVSVMEEDDNPNTLNHKLEDSPEGMVMGGVNLRENEELRKRLSVVTYVTKETEIPPVLIMHGTKDFTVNTQQSTVLYRRLKACGKTAEYYMIDGAVHGGAEFWTEEMIDLMDNFMKRCFE